MIGQAHTAIFLSIGGKLIGNGVKQLPRDAVQINTLLVLVERYRCHLAAEMISCICRFCMVGPVTHSLNSSKNMILVLLRSCFLFSGDSFFALRGPILRWGPVLFH